MNGKIDKGHFGTVAHPDIAKEAKDKAVMKELLSRRLVDETSNGGPVTPLILQQQVTGPDGQEGLLQEIHAGWTKKEFCILEAFRRLEFDYQQEVDNEFVEVAVNLGCSLFDAMREACK